MLEPRPRDFLRHVIAGAGHSSNLDQPAAFDQVLLDFLDSLPGGG